MNDQLRLGEIREERRDPGWFMYFPGDYRWSAAMCNILGTAVFGGSDVGEAHRAASHLRGHEGNDRVWFEVWSSLGNTILGLAKDAEKGRHYTTAKGAYLRATTYFHMAERFRVKKDELAQRAFRSGVESFQAFARLSALPRVDPVSVPFGSERLSAYFVHPLSPRALRVPCVVFLDGLDITKELQFLKGVTDLAARGIACLVMDGPGYGTAIRWSGLKLRPDYEVVGTAAFDYLIGRNDVDASRIGVLGISLGGYYVTRCAGSDDRFAAAAAWGAIWDYKATWTRRLERAGSSTSVPINHLLWILGAADYEEALGMLDAYDLRDVADQIQCPFLITHGAADEQIPLADAQSLFEAVGSSRKELKIFSVAEGGTQHCQRDYLSAGASYIFDWFERILIHERAEGVVE